GWEARAGPGQEGHDAAGVGAPAGTSTAAIAAAAPASATCALHAINVDAKVPHAVAMHAIQVGPALARLLGFTGLPERRRLGLVWAAAGYGALVAVSVTQTAAGRAPFDLGPAAAALTLAGGALPGTAYRARLRALP